MQKNAKTNQSRPWSSNHDKHITYCTDPNIIKGSMPTHTSKKDTPHVIATIKVNSDPTS